MVRVLLVIEDYNEMIYLQTILKKIGLDVEGLNNSKKYTDASLGFNPQIVVSTAQGKTVDILSYGKDIHKNRGLPKIIALRDGSNQISEQTMQEAGVDLVIDTPVNIRKLVLGITSLVDINESSFLEKLSKLESKNEPDNDDGIMSIGSLDNFDGDVAEHKAKREILEMMGSSNDKVFVTGQSEQKQTLTNNSVQRKNRFETFLKNMEKPSPSFFKRDRILDFNKKIRSAPPPDDLNEVEDERKNFVKALFNKKPK